MLSGTVPVEVLQPPRRDNLLRRDRVGDDGALSIVLDRSEKGFNVPLSASRA